jgi:hypothetical protein
MVPDASTRERTLNASAGVDIFTAPIAFIPLPSKTFPNGPKITINKINK